jgi:outer membrane receptor protein involved in Fe transport
VCASVCILSGGRAWPQASGVAANPKGACGLVAALPAPGKSPPPVAHAEIRDDGGKLLAVTDGNGAFCLPASQLAPTGGSVVAAGYLAATWTAPPSQEFWTGQSWVITLEPGAKPVENVEVTAYRTPLATLDSPASTRTLSHATLAQAASPTLDGKLREVPGFELFRRTSALVANPTTQGLSLRGLGSTAASRTLVISKDVPLNDPYGGWIHWNELPSLAVASVEVVRGGASDLYGSSAIGGVVNVIPVTPPIASKAARLELVSDYGAEQTTDNAALGSLSRGLYGGLFAAGLTATDGYTLVAPALRGAVDTHSNVHAENGLVEIDRALDGPGSGSRLFLRGNVLNENRHNGTPLTRNATRLWRYAAGADLERLSARAFGSSERYYQSFSSISAGRALEKLTRTNEDPASELGASLRWTQPVFKDTLVVAGGDVRDVRAADYAYAPPNGAGRVGSPTATTARQRQSGGYGELLSTPGVWTLSGSARVDHFTNADAAQYPAAGGMVAEPSLSETVVDPRLGISRRLTPEFALNASGFRAYRAPTENELYRTGQVGQQTTLPNPRLRSERATGWEAGIAAEPRGSALRASYFWTQVNRPITALTLSTTATGETLMRENLGQIESRGVSFDASVHPTVTFPAETRLTLEGGYQYAIATVTKFTQEPALVGKWIPQVARNAGTLQATAANDRLGLLSVQARASGRQFDDDENQYELHSYVRFDVYASHSFGRRYEAFVAVENLLDRSIDAGRTPVLTRGTPQLARFGLRVRLGE